jgi:hypothetical protein
MADIIIYTFAILFLLLFFLGSIQEQRRFIESLDWIKAEATVVEKILTSTEPNDYGAIVEYEFDGSLYESRAEMFLNKSFRGKLKGEKVIVKINPKEPSHCVLFS